MSEVESIFKEWFDRCVECHTIYDARSSGGTVNEEHTDDQSLWGDYCDYHYIALMMRLERAAEGVAPTRSLEDEDTVRDDPSTRY